MGKYDIFRHLMEKNQWDDFEDLARFNYFNRTYSTFTSALIVLQKPGATIVKSENAWNKIGRFIRPDATPMIILQPNGPVMPVYDITDTYGDELKTPADKDSQKAEYSRRKLFTVGEEEYRSLTGRLSRYGIIFKETGYGKRLYGHAAALETPIKVTYRRRVRDGWAEIDIPAYFQITLSSNQSPHDRALTLFHELGHLYCGHIAGGKRTEHNKIPEYRGNLLDADTIEFEAEMVCRLICDRCSLENQCDEYLRAHMTEGKVPPYDKAAVFAAADRINKMLGLF